MWEQLRHGNREDYDLAVVEARPLEPLALPQEKVLHVRARGAWSATLLGVSTFLPVFGYMLLLFILLIAKIVLKVMRVATLYVLEALTEHDPIREPKDFMPFTILGTALGTLGSAVKAIVTLIGPSH
jgi:uncharacterized metal-binding protein